MAEQDILSAKLEVKDTFTSQLNKFVTAVNNSENAFEKFMTKVEQSTSKMEQSIDKVNKKLDQFTQKVNSVTNSISENVTKSAQKVEQSQTNSMNNILKKYTKMGDNVKDVFKSINKDSETLAKSGLKINIGGNSKKETINDSSAQSIGNVKTENLFNGALSGNFSRILGSLSIIGAGILGAKKVMDTVEGWLQQGYNVLNSLSTGLLSVDGIKEGLQEAGQFQNNRVALDTLYDSESIGQNYYQIGTKAAKKTPFGEAEVGELQKKLAGTHVKYKYDDLLTILDLASIKPELGAEHVGFSLVDAMYGRTTSLKTNYMIDNKAVQEYLKKAMNGKEKNKDGSIVNGKNWKNAFNEKGSVDNKQEYLDLLLSYIRNETNFNGLTEKYSHTINGQIDRLKGNWETLKADLLGLDANGTGMAKLGKITVFSSIKDGLDKLDTWLDSDNAKEVLNSLGDGLGRAVHSVVEAFEYALEHVNWKLVGDTFEKIGKQIEDFIERITKDGTLDKLLNALPSLAEKAINNQVLDKENKVTVANDITHGNWFSAGIHDIYGQVAKAESNLGIISSDQASHLYDYSGSNNKSMLENWWDGLWEKPNSDNVNFSDTNASEILAQNSNLTDDDKNTIQNMMQNDNTPVYNITIGEIKADSVEDIVASLQKYQSNTK